MLATKVMLRDRADYSVLSADDILEIRRLDQEDNMSLQDIANEFDLPRPMVLAIVNCRNWAEVQRLRRGEWK